jgi:excisionase family DNA binding protein
VSKLLTLEQTAERLNISKRSVRRLISTGALPAVAINTRIIRVAERDLAAVLRPVLPGRIRWVTARE